VNPVDQERLDVANAMAERLLRGLKGVNTLRGKALERMKLVELAVSYLEAARALP
jgi:hypothetical protein